MTPPPERSPSPGTAVGLVAAGLVLGLVGSVVSAARVVVGGVTVPWGLVLTAATVVAAVRAASWTLGSRRAGAAVMVGWFVATAAVLALSPGGDVLMPDVPRTYAYLVATGFLGLVAASWPVVRIEPVAEEAWEGLPPEPLEPSGDADSVR